MIAVDTNLLVYWVPGLRPSASSTEYANSGLPTATSPGSRSSRRGIHWLRSKLQPHISSHEITEEKDFACPLAQC